MWIYVSIRNKNIYRCDTTCQFGSSGCISSQLRKLIDTYVDADIYCILSNNPNRSSTNIKIVQGQFSVLKFGVIHEMINKIHIGNIPVPEGIHTYMSEVIIVDNYN